MRALWEPAVPLFQRRHCPTWFGNCPISTLAAVSGGVRDLEATGGHAADWTLFSRMYLMASSPITGLVNSLQLDFVIVPGDKFLRWQTGASSCDERQ
jgi:hypothetical protein